MGGRGLTVVECSRTLGKQSSEDENGVGVFRGQSEGRNRVGLCHFLCHLHDTRGDCMPPHATACYRMKRCEKITG